MGISVLPLFNFRTRALDDLAPKLAHSLVGKVLSVEKGGILLGPSALEGLVSGLFLPLYFVSSGLKTNVATIEGLQSWGFLGLVIVTACFGKIIGTVTVSLACKIPFKEALALGFLMNTKGLVELIVLNIGKDRKVLNDQTFAIMALMAVFTTFITTPLVMAVYKPNPKASNRVTYKHRTIKRKDSDSELRIFACFHSARNIPTMINLIETSRGTDKKEGLCVYAMHLMESPKGHLHPGITLNVVHFQPSSEISGEIARTDTNDIVFFVV